MADAPTTARARARVALTEDIKQTARRHLAETGPGGLSLRAVARELDMVSSAIYRYFASRDELLTALIIDAYEAVGEAVEIAAADSRGGLDARWRRVAQAVRAWALAHPHEYALVYGSPVAGYQAPTDTIAPAARVSVAALGVVAEAVQAGEIDVDQASPIPRPVRADLSQIRAALDLDLSDEVMGRALFAWTQLLGHISFELFGHLEGTVTDREALFDHQVTRSVRVLLAP